MYHTDTFEQKMQSIIAAISDAGYDPYTQISGYLQTGDSVYITRMGGARQTIETLDKERLKQFVEQLHM